MERMRTCVAVSMALVFIGVSAPFPARALASPNKDLSACPHYHIELSEGLLSLNVREADPVCLLRAIAGETGIDLSIDPALKGTVTLRAEKEPLERVVQKICANRAVVFSYDKENNRYSIVRLGAFVSEEPSKTDGGDIHGPRHEAVENRRPEGASSPSQAASATSGIDGDRRVGPALSSPSSDLDRKGRPRYKERELLIRFKEGASKEHIEAFTQSLQVISAKKIYRGKFYKVVLPRRIAEAQAIERCEKSGIVDMVERNALRYPLMTAPNDPRYAEQWALPMISLPEAWDVTQGNSSIVVALIDTGVDYLHPDLSPCIWINEREANGIPGVDDDGNGFVDDIRGWDFAGTESAIDDPDADPMDGSDHGTHMAGIVAAAVDNGIGICGVAPGVRIMPLKALADKSGYMAADDIIEALAYAADMGAHIVNCSFGGDESRSEYQAFSDLGQAGILAVCAAGNEGPYYAANPVYPAGYDLDNIISVAASKRDDTLASYSCYGLPHVDLMAPGDHILSTVPSTLGYTEASVTVGVPPDSSSYEAAALEYAGTTDDAGITAPLYFCGKGNAADFPPVAGAFIALIERGDLYFYFYEKTANAVDHGAAAVIIYNDKTDAFDDWTLNPPPSGTAWPPVVGISRESGLAIRAALESADAPLSATVYNITADTPVGYSTMSGTSMATPHVSGVAALLLSVKPELTYRQLKAAILDTVDASDALSDKLVAGGRLNARAALRSVFDTTGDVSGNNIQGLEDVILALQIVTGVVPADIRTTYVNSEDDIGGNGVIGLEEAVYILHKIANTTTHH